MENKKSAPKAKNTTVKSKANTVPANENKPKTAKNIRSATVPMGAVDTLKRQYVKGKAELQRQTEEQEQSPENYAVDTVEDKAESAVYAAADAVKQTGRYVKNSVGRRSRDRNNPNDASDIAPPNVEPPQMALPEAKQAPQERMKIQARQDAAVKAKEHKSDIKTKKMLQYVTLMSCLKSRLRIVFYLSVNIQMQICQKSKKSKYSSECKSKLWQKREFRNRFKMQILCRNGRFYILMRRIPHLK